VPALFSRVRRDHVESFSHLGVFGDCSHLLSSSQRAAIDAYGARADETVQLLLKQANPAVTVVVHTEFAAAARAGSGALPNCSPGHVWHVQAIDQSDAAFLNTSDRFPALRSVWAAPRAVLLTARAAPKRADRFSVPFLSKCDFLERNAVPAPFSAKCLDGAVRALADVLPAAVLRALSAPARDAVPIKPRADSARLRGGSPQAWRLDAHAQPPLLALALLHPFLIAALLGFVFAIGVRRFFPRCTVPALLSRVRGSLPCLQHVKR
jgi:hypothetical protein